MRCRTLFAAVAIFALLCFATAEAAAPKAADKKPATESPSVETPSGTPQADLPELSFNFDPVVDGTQVTHDFAIKNTGDGPLAIHQVKTG